MHEKNSISRWAFYILFTFACADVLAFRVGGASVRIFYFFAVFAIVVNLRAIRFERKYFTSYCWFLLSLLPSIAFSIDRVRSAVYFIWVILTFLCTYLPVRFSASQGIFGVNGFDRLKWSLLIIHVYRFQVLVALLLFVAGIHERPQFLYYEPSYFAISLAFYVSAVLYRFFEQRKGWFDIFLILAFFIFSFSGTFILVLGLLLIFHIFERHWLKSLPYVALLLLGAVAYVIFVDDPNTLVIRGMFNGRFAVEELLLRGGNRMYRALAAVDAFTQNWVHGLGLGAFEQYSQGISVGEVDEDKPWLSGVGQPAINIYLELAATTGIIGLMGFLGLFFPMLKWMLGRGFGSPAVKSLLVMLIVLSFESNYLRPYLWLALAFAWLEFRSIAARSGPSPASRA